MKKKKKKNYICGFMNLCAFYIGFFCCDLDVNNVLWVFMSLEGTEYDHWVSHLCS